MIPYYTEETFPGADIKGGVRRNNWAHITTQTEWRYDIAAKYTDEMIADGDILNISYIKQVAPHSEYYVEFAVIPYENTFDLAVNIFKSQQGDIDIVGDTSGFYTKGEVDEKLSAKVTNLSAVAGIMKISQADYSTLSAGGTADENTLYVIV